MAAPGITKKILVDIKPNGSLLDPDFDGYKLNLDPVPMYEEQIPGVFHAEPTSDQYSFQHIRLFGLHNHLYGDPWRNTDVYYFSETGKLERNTWNPETRRFESQTVWCESEFLGTCNGREPGDYNYSLCLDCKDKAFILNGKKDATLCFIDTGDRTAGVDWSKEGIKIGKVPSGILMNVERVTSEEKDPTYHVLIQSVTESASIDELNIASKDSASLFATLLHWITIDKANSELSADDAGCYKIIAQRDICSAGPVDYTAFESGAHALYVAYTKRAFFVNDSCRPVTPVMERALRKPVRYFWEENDSEIIVRFSLPWLLKEVDLQVTVDDQHIAIGVLLEGRSRSIISGDTFRKVNQDSSTAKWTVGDGRVELKLRKEVEGETWEEFIPGDENSQRAVDPETLKQATNGLQKLTSNTEEEGEVVPGFNAEQLEECDASPPDTARLIRLSTETHKPTHRVQLSAHQWICGVRLTPENVPGLVLRHDVDAIVCQPGNTSEDTWEIKHVNTFAAFGYVQASKEQRKFIVCPPDLGYIAICESTENSPHVYIYHQPSQLTTELRNRSTGRKVTSVAKQQVVRTPTTVGRILGAYAANSTLFLLFKTSIITLKVE